MGKPRLILGLTHQNVSKSSKNSQNLLENPKTYVKVKCSKTHEVFERLLLPGFLKYPFGHLFQTEIKIDFKTN